VSRPERERAGGLDWTRQQAPRCLNAQRVRVSTPQANRATTTTGGPARHTGTHFDAPVHWLSGKGLDDVASVPPRRLVGRPRSWTFRSRRAPIPTSCWGATTSRTGRASTVRCRRTAGCCTARDGTAGWTVRRASSTAAIPRVWPLTAPAGSPRTPPSSGSGSRRWHRCRPGSLVRRPALSLPLVLPPSQQVRADPAPAAGRAAAAGSACHRWPAAHRGRLGESGPGARPGGTVEYVRSRFQ